jgi:hypothetical protein
VLTKETLEQSLTEAAETVRNRQEDVEGARRRLTEAERELRLLTELAQIRGVELPEAARVVVHGSATPGTNGSAAGRTQPQSKSTLLNTVVEILEARGEAMQIQDLMEAVRQRQVRIPGKGAQANLIAHISRDPRIVRPRRGFYGLAAWGLNDITPAPRARRRSRRSGGSR